MDFTKYRKIVVHHSRPHFDDCMCVAMMKIINPKIKISRKNTIYPDLIDDNILICDIGHGKYDHHQIDTETHLDGSKYCACTLLYRDIKDLLFTNKTAQSNFEQILTDIEYNDNTGKITNFSNYANIFYPPYGVKKDVSEQFNEMVDFLYNLTKCAINIDERFNEFYTKQKENSLDDILFNILQSAIINNCEKYELEKLKEYVIENCEKLEDFNNLKEIEPEFIGSSVQRVIDNFNVEYIKYFLIAQIFDGIDLNKTNHINDIEQMIYKSKQLMDDTTIYLSKLIDSQLAINELNKKLQDEILPNVKNHTIIFEKGQGMPWKTACIDNDVLFTVMPDSRSSGYLLLAAVKFNNVNKIDIPLEFIDRANCNTVHPSQFLANFKTKEDAINAANELIEKGMENLESIFYTFYDIENDNTIQNLICALNVIKSYQKEMNLDKIETIKNVFNFIEDMNIEEKIDTNNFNILFYALCEFSKNNELTSQELVDIYKEKNNLANFLQLNDESYIVNNTKSRKICTKDEICENLNTDEIAI